MNVAVVVGNPKPGSRTLEAATRLAARLGDEPPRLVIDVVGLGPGLLGWGDEAVAAAVASVESAGAVVVASPTYKASYTGIRDCSWISSPQAAWPEWWPSRSCWAGRGCTPSPRKCLASGAGRTGRHLSGQRSLPP